MNNQPTIRIADIENTGEALFNYAINREEIKWLMANLHKDADINRSKVEYELQMLKFIGVGWSIAYFMRDAQVSRRLSARYWSSIQAFSQNISNTTVMMIGQKLDYFAMVKERFNMYVNAMQQHPEAADPVAVIGREFARQCGNTADIFTAMIGAKIFHAALTRVREYLTQTSNGVPEQV